MWSPSEVCSFAQKSDKVLESPQKIYTDGFIAAAVKNGSCIADDSCTVIRANAGNILILAKEVTIFPTDGNCIVYMCEIKGTAAKGLANFGMFTVNGAAVPAVWALFEKIFKSEKEIGSAEAFALICALFNAKEKTASIIPPLVTAAMEQMHENYSGIYGVEELSDNLGVSKSHLIRCFSAALGKSPGEYLTEVRISAAKQLLANPQYNLEIIAGLCGFSGANYLCRVFKRKTGYSPAQYRKMLSLSEHTSLPQEERLYL